MSHTHRILAAALLAVVTLACDSGVTRQSARAQATSLTCQRYDMCMMVGAGKTYADHEACEIAWQANWDGAWPAADCEGKINQAELETCLAAIRSTSCMGGLDFLSTVFVKCGKQTVCSGGGSPPADAGGN
jgi:hypothetical protein